MFFTFKVYRPGHAVWTRKRIFAETLQEAYERIDSWCYENGYEDFELEED